MERKYGWYFKEIAKDSKLVKSSDNRLNDQTRRFLVEK